MKERDYKNEARDYITPCMGCGKKQQHWSGKCPECRKKKCKVCGTSIKSGDLCSKDLGHRRWHTRGLIDETFV